MTLREQLRVIAVPPGQRKDPSADGPTLEFGRRFTDHMFSMKYSEERGWYEPAITPHAQLSLAPSACVFHYGQEIFEGMKAFAAPSGLMLFRAADHLQRMNRSARLLCMPQIDTAFVEEALKALCTLDREWIPATEGASLYLRPTMIAVEEGLGVRPANEYLFFVIACPAQAYYGASGTTIEPVRILVSDEHTRTVRGGTGQAKAGGNYAASLRASKAASAARCSQTLWLDALERRYVEEVGTMNIFFVLDDVLVTPALGETVLAGITRDSVIKMARARGWQVEERPVDIAEALAGSRSGRLTEAFGSGTAVGISPIETLVFHGEEYDVGDRAAGSRAIELHHALQAARTGRLPGFEAWVSRVATSELG